MQNENVVIKHSRLHALLACAIIVVNIVIHVFLISYPPDPVFDEYHFATYAASYASRSYHYDIHPPLGKLMYALPLVLFEDSSNYIDARFIGTRGELQNGRDIEFISVVDTYGSFPYLPLRLVSAFFGVILAIATYFFIRAITNSPVAALWGMFFVTFENIILLDTRLIHLDGMLLAFGISSLALFFSKRVRPAFAGLVWGLALSVKLTAIVFLGPVILLAASKITHDWKTTLRSAFSMLAKFATSGFLVLFITLFLVHPFTMPLQDRVNGLGYRFDNEEQKDEFVQLFGNETPYPILRSEFARHMVISYLNIFSQANGYVSGKPELSVFESPWYMWPLMNKIAPYYQQKDIHSGYEKNISFAGNPVIWGMGLFALLLTFLKFISKRLRDKNHTTLLILFGGYIFALLPFGFVTRGVSLHHYFSAFLFEICILAYTIAYAQETYPRQARAFTYILIAFTIIGFALMLPYTYGLSLPIR